jgi:hypothetical protein
MPEPTVRALLLDQVDEHVAVVHQGLNHIETIVAQLDTDRFVSCRIALAMVHAMLDEVNLRAHQ